MQERLNQIVKQKNLTAARFAEILGVNASTISHILAGRNKPGFDIINSIAIKFPDISLDWLITGNEPMYKQSLMEPTPQSEIQNLPLDSSALSKEQRPKAAIKNMTDPIAKSSIPDLFDASAINLPQEKKVKRIILFFDDGSFEDYQK